MEEWRSSLNFCYLRQIWIRYQNFTQKYTSRQAIKSSQRLRKCADVFVNVLMVNGET